MFITLHPRGGWRCALLGAFGLAALLSLAATPAALARDAYVGNEGDGTASVVDLASAGTVGGPIATGAGAGAIAITPDGAKAYVANHEADSVSVIDTASDEVVGGAIAVGEGPRGVAVSPDGRRVYVANQQSGTVSVIDTASDEVVDEFVSLAGARGIAVSPDGSRLYVGQEGTDTVAVVDTETGAVGTPITVGLDPQGIAFTPDGAKAYVANLFSQSVSVIDTATQTVTATITVGHNPVGVAVSPDGRLAYVANAGSDSVSAIDTETDSVVGEPIEVGTGPRGVAFSPDGSRAYVATGYFTLNPGTLTAIDTASDETVDTPITIGHHPLGVAVVPDQPPLASLAPAAGTAGQPVRFDASASRDPDGRIARYDWSFGDGETALDAGPTPTHTYDAPGSYDATVTLADTEGCSTGFVFTGVTANCNGSPAAAATRTVQVSPPPEQAEPVLPVAAPSSRFHIRGLHRNKRRGIARLTIRVPGAGVLLLRGGRVRTVRRQVGRARAVTLVVRAKRGRGRLRALKRHGRLKVRARIAFHGAGGTPFTRFKRLTLVRRR